MRTCTDCGCVVGDGGDHAHASWHNRLDLLAGAIAQLEEVTGLYDEDHRPYVPVEDVDTKGRT